MNDELAQKIESGIQAKQIYAKGFYHYQEISSGNYIFFNVDETESEIIIYDSMQEELVNETFTSFAYVKINNQVQVSNYGLLIKQDYLNELGYANAKELYEALVDQKDYSKSMYLIGSDLVSGQYEMIAKEVEKDFYLDISIMQQPLNKEGKIKECEANTKYYLLKDDYLLVKAGNYMLLEEL